MGCGAEHSQSPASDGNLAGSEATSGAGQRRSDAEQLGSGSWDPLAETAAASGGGGAPLPAAFSHRVPHFQQAYNW